MRRVLAVIEDPGAANGMVGLRESLAKQDITFDLFANGAALTYAPSIGLEVSAAPDDFSIMLQKNKLGAVLIGTSENPDAIAFSVIDQARALDIHTVGFVDGPANAQHRFRGRTENSLAHIPNSLLVSDHLARDVFIDLGMSAKAIHVVGHPNMDRVRDRKAELMHEGKAQVRARVFPGIPAASPLVLFAAEISNGLDLNEFRRNQDYTLLGSGIYDGRTEICLEEVISVLHTCNDQPCLALRLHPKNDPKTFVPFGDDIDAINADGDPLEAVFAADIIIGMTSILLFEAAILGLPTISVTPRKLESAWLTSIGLGLTPQVCTREALQNALQNLVHTPSAFVTPNIDIIVPPGAAQRMTEHLMHIMAGTRE